MTLSLRAAMTTHPHSIRLDATVHTAMSQIATLDVRHLPVLAAGVLRGVVSDRDLKLVRGEAISGLEWGVYLGAGFGVGLVLWWLAARRYHDERLAISA